MDPKELIRFVVWYATKVRGQVSRIRLMKFLYLADWHAAKLGGQPITSYHWRFHHYGPYAVEAQRDIDRSTQQGLIEMKLVEGSEYEEVHLFRCYGDEPEVWKEIRMSVYSILRQEIQRWIGKPLPEFLDYVYFETEPMIHARRGEPLDFAVIEPSVEPSPPSSLKGKPSQETRKKISEFLERARGARRIGPPPIYDHMYEQAVKFLDDQDSLSGELHGQVNVGEDSSSRQND